MCRLSLLYILLKNIITALPVIQPKPQIEICTNANLSEILTIHTLQEDPRKNLEIKTNGNSNISSYPEDLITEASLPSAKLKTSVPQSDCDLNISSVDELVEPKTSDITAITPPKTTNPKKNTPKSGSHVRNLDFSTPPKITSTHKKSIRTKQVDRKCMDSKRQAAKILFKKDEKLTNRSNEKLADSTPWDAKLRKYIPISQKSNAKNSKSKKTSKTKKRNCANENLNTTEHDAAMLEAALKTPLKSNEHNSENEWKESSSKFTNKEIDVVIDNNLEKKIIMKDMTSEGHKTVLSPSKLNANKRNIVSNTVNESSDKFVTPEVTHESSCYPIKANRNIIPMLETPLKDNLPKTPGIETATPCEFNISSLSNFTPVSKMIEANLPGFDINLPTPNIPITPNFPAFTPTVDLMSSYSNRPTDYSTSSSYYQPSDSEQNKSLEVQLREIEKKTICDDTRNEVSAKQHLNIFNKNVIGKKNLNLMKRPETNVSNSSSSSSASDISEDEQESSTAWTEKESNDTVICKKKVNETPRKTYSLRNRNVSSKIITPKIFLSEELETDSVKNVKQVQIEGSHKSPKKASHIKAINNTEESYVEFRSCSKVQSEESEDMKFKIGTSTKSSKGRTALCHESVLKELEEKRLRTIKKFKNNDSTPAAKQKKTTGGFIKIKPIANVSNHRRKPRKSDSPKKKIQTKIASKSLLNTLRKDLAGSESEDDISLRLSVSEDEEKIQKFVNKNIKILETSEKSASDVEAQNLIEGLRERGIHLMHNKITKSQDSSSKTVQDFEANEDEVKEKTISNISPSGQNQDDTGFTLNYSFRDAFDTCLQTEEICLVFDEDYISQPPIERNDISKDLKTLRARLFIEEINEEIDIEFRLSDFHVLLDISPSQLNDQQRNEIKITCPELSTKDVPNDLKIPIADEKMETNKEEPQSPTR